MLRFLEMIRNRSVTYHSPLFNLTVSLVPNEMTGICDQCAPYSKMLLRDHFKRGLSAFKNDFYFRKGLTRG